MPKKNVKKQGGRPVGSGKYKEKTVSIRVPLTLEAYVNELLEDYIKNGFYVKVIDEHGMVYDIENSA